MDSKYSIQSITGRFQKTGVYAKVCAIGNQLADFRMADFKEFLQLLWLNLVVGKRNFVEYIRVLLRYYHHRAFAKVDTLNSADVSLPQSFYD